jgi:hypothetical protein
MMSTDFSAWQQRACADGVQVCRKPIPGGLGPHEYRLGSVVLLETRVARAGEPEILSLA